MKPLPLLLAVTLLAGCCGSGGGSDAPDPPAATRADVCAEVTAGIAAFNAGDLQETVARFQAALPIARAADRDAGSTASSELLDAVEYYADLAPEDYLEASATSPDFARNKAITLGQCAAEPEAGTVEA